MSLKTTSLILGPVRTNCYIAWCSETLSAAVIDPGDAPEHILKRIGDLGLDLKYIFLTHGHFDHIMALPELRAQTEAKTVIHSDDADCLTDRRKSLMPRVKSDDLAPADILASDGQEFTVGNLTFTWIHTPGHTVGSSVIRCEDTLFTGDTLFAGDCGRCDLPGGDYGQMLRSLKKLHDLPGEYRVLPGHEEESTLQQERQTNPYMREGAALED